MMTNNKLKIGDIVTLGSSEPPMTVGKIEDKRIWCQWFVGDKLNCQWFINGSYHSSVKYENISAVAFANQKGQSIH